MLRLPVAVRGAAAEVHVAPGLVRDRAQRVEDTSRIVILLVSSRTRSRVPTSRSATSRPATVLSRSPRCRRRSTRLAVALAGGRADREAPPGAGWSNRVPALARELPV